MFALNSMTTSIDPNRLVGGRYVLEKLIGEGGTGEVWRARHVTLRSPVAIKLLHGSAAFRESTRKRFLTEARVAAQLNTRHAVKVFDFGVTEQGRPYLIMELLDGETLAERLEREKRLSPYATARILRLASRALDAAHSLGVVHRDFKPENIFLVRTEEDEEDVKVVDFGVAKLVGELEERDPEDTAPMSTRRLEKAFISFTRSGKSVGTPCYMAPEQAKAELDVGHTADVWAIGVVAYECLTGFRPFVAADIKTLFDRISSCTHVPARERNPALPQSFDDWFRTACAPDPKDRFPNASAATLALIEVLGIQGSMITLGDSEILPSLIPSVRSSSSGPAGPPSSGSATRFTSLTPGASSALRSQPSSRVRLPRLAFGLALIVGLGIAATAWWQLRAAPVPSTAASQAPAASVSSVVTPESTASVDPEPDASVPASSILPAQPIPTKERDTTKSSPRDKTPRMEGYRELPRSWPSSTSVAEPVAPATSEPPKKPPPPKPPDATATSSPFELPELGL